MTVDKAARKATLKRYYEKHKDERKALNKEWYEKKVGTGYNTGKRRKRVPADFNKDEWEWCLRIYDGRCLRCGSRENVERDHVIPVDAGGSKSGDNLQPLCRACNAAKKNHLFDFRRGTIVRLFGLGYIKGMM
jgi:5-methylcytosine-specific restriction endonuclease McrA